MKYIPQDHEPGQPINFQVAAVTPSGSLKEDLSSLTAMVYRVIQHYVLSESEGKARYRLEEELSLEREETFSLVQGIGKYAFTPPDYGLYLLEISDPEIGSAASCRFTVYGKYKLFPQGEALFDRVNLVTDKERYLPGEEATVVYQAPFPGKALFTIETDRILWQKAMEIEEEQGTIRIPVTEAMIPNAYFSVTMVRNQEPTPLPQRALGTVPIFIDRKNTLLQVSIEAPEHVRPKTILPVKIRVHNSSSTPVSGAELSLTLVDVGLLQLTAERTPDPWSFFNEKRKLTVGIFDPYSNLIIPEVATTPLLHPAGGEAAELLKAEFAPLRPRAFQIVSFFLPTLKTDEEGLVEAQIQLPDFDGRLRIIAVAIKGENFGAGEKDILCRDLIVTEIVAPKAVAPKDAFEIVLSLFSQVEYTETVHVTLSTNGLLELQGPQEFTLEIPRGSKVVRFLPVQVKDLLGEGILTVKTTFSGGEREDQASFIIRPITPRIPLFGSGRFQPSERKRIDLPSDWLPGSAQGYITISPSPQVDLTRFAEMLFEYPYGCLEQTVSSAWGLLLLPDLLRDVDPLLANETEVRNAMEQRIRRILSMQTYEGAFSVWPGYSESRLWDSVYTTHFLQEAKKRGWEVPEESLQGAHNFLLTLLALQPYLEEEWYLRGLFSAQSYAAYVLTLSGEAPLAWMEHLRERKKFLYDSGLLLLALAYAQVGQKEVAQELAGRYVPNPEATSQTGDIYESPSRQMSLHLLLSLELDPSSAYATNIANNIRSQLAKTEYLSTQENAFVIMALEKYFQGQKFAPYITFTLYDTMGKELRHFVNKERVTLSTEVLPPSFQIENQTSAKLFYLWNVDGVPTTPHKPWERGITVKRIYLDENGELKDPQRVQSGEMLQVLIHISSGQTLENVVIVDPLPGGVEIENPRLATSAVYEEKTEESLVHFEIRDDRIILFVPIISREFEYRYTVRAVTVGDFALPQIKAECMYNPATSALREEGRVVIRRE
ncbi:MAG: alpha-2-macroglobulin family protein [Candidatus Caldatribacteriaceae bacterium]